MSGSNSETPGAGPGRRLSRLSRRAKLLAGVGALAVIALLAAGLIPTLGGSGKPTPSGSVRATAPPGAGTPAGPGRQAKVFGSNIPADQYGTFISRRENQAVDANGDLISELSPLPPKSFDRPVAAYLRYAEGWATQLGRDLPPLRSALAADDRTEARRRWQRAFSDYLHLGAVYGLLPGSLDDSIDGVPTTLGSVSNLTGLHRIEQGLWTGIVPRSLVPFADRLEGDDVRLRKVLPKTEIDPLDYATRAHEILEDAQRDLLSGTEVPWSGAGVLGTAAGIAATKEVITTLTPLLQGRDNTLVVVDNWLGKLQSAVDRVRTAHGGNWPTLEQLTPAQREQLNGTLAGTVTALSMVPGTLETAPIPVIPKLATTR